MWRRRNFICDPTDLVLWSADVTLIRSPGAAVASVCVLVASLLAGCSTSDGVGSFIVDPGHYSVYHCDGLAARLKVLLAREQELANLMNRASEGGGGVLIGNLAYRTDYENAVGEEKVLRRAAAEKKCELPPPAQPMSSTPAPYAAQPAPATVPIFQSDQTIH
jgi:predicted small secreted protein